MLRIFKTVNDLLVPQDQPGKNCWINLYMPTEAELTKVSEATGIPWDFLSDPLDADERARIESDDDYLLIVIQAPIQNDSNDRGPYLTVPIGIIITPEVVVTVCRSSHDLVSQLLTIRPKNISTSERMGFAFNILMRAATHYLLALKNFAPPGAAFGIYACPNENPPTLQGRSLWGDSMQRKRLQTRR